MSPKIEIIKNGPYKITGSVPLGRETAEADMVLPSEWKVGESFPDRETYLLCRCGKSSNIPYCDGTHEKVGFEGTETAGFESYDSRAEKIEGPGMDLTDVPALCSSARFCDRMGGTWDLVRKSDDPEARETAIEQACNCPSGRLVAIDKESGKPIEPEFEKSISVTEDPGANVSGPLWVKGGIPIVSESGETYEQRNRVTLCRCGQSKNKPLCDGSHIAAKFRGTPAE